MIHFSRFFSIFFIIGILFISIGTVSAQQQDPAANEPQAAAPVQEGIESLTNSLGMTFNRIPAGTFIMVSSVRFRVLSF